MVACSGAVGKPGEPGPAGPPGEPSEPTNLPPIARAPTLDAVMLMEEGDAATIDVAANFVDPEGEALTFAASAAPEGVVTVELAAGVLTVDDVAVGDAVITVTATDDGGLTASATINVTVHPEGMAPPTYDESLVDIIALKPGEQDVISGADIVNAFDESEGESLAYGASGSDDTIVLVTQADDNTVTITALAVEGDATVTITATDEDDLTVEHVIEVAVRATLQPEASGTPSSVDLTVGGGATEVDVSGYFSDPGVGDLTYAALSDDETVAIAGTDGSSIVEIEPVGPGSAMVTVSASNAYGSDSQTISVNVAATPPTQSGSIPAVTLMVGQTATPIRLATYFAPGAAGDILTYTASVTPVGVVSATVLSDSLLITALAAGPATITVTATDAADGETAMQMFMVTVEAEDEPDQNEAPRVKKELENRKAELGDTGDANVNQEVMIELSDHFEDPEGGPLYYSVSIVSQSPTATTTPAPKVIDLVAGYPDGTDLNSSLVIDAMNTGTAMVKVVARDAQLAATESMFMITVIEVDGNSTPETVAAADPAGVIANVDGAPPSTRLKVGETKKVIDNRKISEYFTDNDFPSVTLNARGDTLTFEVKSYANGTSVADLVTDGALEDVTPLAADKAQVSTSLSKTTWNGDDSTFTLSLTGERGSTAETVATDVVAIIATDEFGKSAVSIFEVRVNHEPQPYGAQAAEDDRTTLGEYEGFMNLSAAAAATTLDLVSADAGYFSDMDGDTMTCAFLTSEHNVADDDKTALVTISGNTLRVDPQNIGTMYVDVWCNDGLEDSDSARLMVEVDRGASIASF